MVKKGGKPSSSKKTGDTSGYRVFVSHATVDKWLAKTMCEKIESTGATTFRDDRDINGGDDIPVALKLAINQSEEFLVVLSPQSVDRRWVLLEVGAAWAFDKLIIPVLCHVTVDAIPDIIKQKKAYLLNDFDQYLLELSKRVK